MTNSRTCIDWAARSILAMATVGLLSPIVAAVEPASYRIEPITFPQPGLGYTAPRWVNTSGHVVGYVEPDVPSEGWTFLYREGSIELIGLHISPNTEEDYSSLQLAGLTNQDRVAGYTTRIMPYVTSYKRRDAWYFDGTASHQIGLIGTGYEYVDQDVGELARTSTSVQINQAGRVIGNSYRYTSQGTSLGEDAWIFNGTQTAPIGFKGPGYERIVDGEIDRDNRVYQLNENNIALGISVRYVPTGAGRGQDVWLDDGTSITRLPGLTGSDYEFVYAPGEIARDSDARLLNDAGMVAGITSRKTAFDAGWDAWFYNGSTTNRIGLIGPEYEWTTNFGNAARASGVDQITQAGRVLGRSSVDSPLDITHPWISDGETTVPIGFHYQGEVLARYMSESGMVAGQSWYTNGQSHNDAWVTDGTTLRKIGLYGGVYNFQSPTGPHSVHELFGMNESGQVIGKTWVNDGQNGIAGYRGWFYDYATDTTIPINPQLSVTGPHLMTDDGVVIGRSLNGSYAFWWSMESGFHDLSALLDASFDPTVWEGYLEALRFAGEGPAGNPLYIIGNGSLNDVGSRGFLMTANITGDFDLDSDLDATDIDLLFAAEQGPIPTAQAIFDVNSNGNVNSIPNTAESDADVWVRDLMSTEYGDINLDGAVNFTDLLVVAQHYEDDTGGWAQGNVDGVAGINFGDLLLLAQSYGFGTLDQNISNVNASFDADWSRARSMVPEPTIGISLLVVVVALQSRRPRDWGVLRIEC